MAIKVTSEGISELKEELIKLGTKAEDVIDKALLVAVKPIHEEMKNKVRVSKLNKAHIRDNIPINKEKTNGSVHSVSLGWTKEDNSKFFYAKYLEWGTSKMKAKPFMQPAIDRKGNDAQNILINEIAKELKI